MTPLCPNCGRDAPIVYRGVVPSCTACGALRAPLSGPSVNLAGKPSRWGGVVTSVFGWLVLLFGLSIALGVGLLLYVLASLGIALAVALPVAFIASGVGIPLVLGGKALGRSGSLVERTTREQALISFALQHGPVTAGDAGRLLGVSTEEADSILTGLAKREPERVALDVDDQGVVRYRVVSPPPAGTPAAWTVGPEPAARVAVDSPLRVASEEQQGITEAAEADAREEQGHAGTTGRRS